MRTVLAAGAVTGCLLGAGPASAHAFLKASVPAVGSTVARAPSQVVIEFTEGIEPRFSSITVQDAAGARVDAGGVHITGDDTHLVVGLQPLAPGNYKVIWHVTATDTHKTQGSFAFAVAP